MSMEKSFYSLCPGRLSLMTSHEMTFEFILQYKGNTVKAFCCRSKGVGGESVLYALFHGWQKIERPQWVPPSAPRNQGRDTLGTERMRERKRERELKTHGGWGACHHMGRIKPQLADFIRPLPPTLPVHPFCPPEPRPSVFLSFLREAEDQKTMFSACWSFTVSSEDFCGFDVCFPDYFL